MPSGTDSSAPEPRSRQIACEACQEPVTDSYFTINRSIVCPDCRRSIEDQLLVGRGFGRFARAALFGVAASMAGASMDLAFLTLSSYDWSVVAVVTGFLVGKAVRKGGGGLGGLSHQVLAMVLTYASLGMTYFAFALLQVNQRAGLASLAHGDVFVILREAMLVPLWSLKSSPFYVACFGFSLWQAWKLNRPGRYVLTGPHRIDKAASNPSPAR